MVKLRYKRDQRVSILIVIAVSQQCAGGSVNPLTPLSWWTSPRCFLGCQEEKEATWVSAFERSACLPAPGGKCTSGLLETTTWETLVILQMTTWLLLKAVWAYAQAISLPALVPAKRILVPVFLVDEVKLWEVLLSRMRELPFLFLILFYYCMLLACVYTCEPMHVWRPKVDLRYPLSCGQASHCTWS